MNRPRPMIGGVSVSEPNITDCFCPPDAYDCCGGCSAGSKAPCCLAISEDGE